MNIDNIIYKGQNIIIPVSKREEMLNIVNETHIWKQSNVKNAQEHVCVGKE